MKYVPFDYLHVPICVSVATCMTFITTSTWWLTSCSTSARPSIPFSITWCQRTTDRSSSPRSATSACPATAHPEVMPTHWHATQSASQATTLYPPMSSKRRCTKGRTIIISTPVVCPEGITWDTLLHTHFTERDVFWCVICECLLSVFWIFDVLMSLF